MRLKPIYLLGIAIVLVGLVILLPKSGLFSVVGGATPVSTQNIGYGFCESNSMDKFLDKDTSTYIEACHSTGISYIKLLYSVPTNVDVVSYTAYYSSGTNGDLQIFCGPNKERTLYETTYFPREVINNVYKGIVQEKTMQIPHDCIINNQITIWWKIHLANAHAESLTYTQSPNECTAGTYKCYDTYHHKCIGGKWVNQGQINGQCGYTSAPCSLGDTKCEGTYYYTCSVNQWIIQGQLNGKCGFTTNTGGDNNETGNNNGSNNLSDLSPIAIFIIIGVVGLVLL